MESSSPPPELEPELLDEELLELELELELDPPPDRVRVMFARLLPRSSVWFSLLASSKVVTAKR